MIIERRHTSKAWKDYVVNNTLEIIMTNLAGIAHEFEGREILSRLYDLAYDSGCIHSIRLTCEINAATEKFLKHTSKRSLYEDFIETTITDFFNEAFIRGGE